MLLLIIDYFLFIILIWGKIEKNRYLSMWRVLEHPIFDTLHGRPTLAWNEKYVKCASRITWAVSKTKIWQRFSFLQSFEVSKH